jgi:hypothetical protein
VKIKLGKDGKPLMVGGKVVTNCDCCGCFQIAIDAGTVSGTFTGGPPTCTSGFSASVPSSAGSNTQVCFADCDCVFNSSSDTAPIMTGPCSCNNPGNTASFTVSPELDLVGSDWILTIFTNVAANCNCSGLNDCGFNNSADSDPSFNLGANPTGTHTLNFTGSSSGASYHVVVTIT